MPLTVVIALLSTLRLDLVYNNQLSSSLLNWLAQFGKSARAHSFPEASKKPCAVPSQHLAYSLCGAGALIKSAFHSLKQLAEMLRKMSAITFWGNAFA